ncbi:hypothetical protein CDAR_309321 [Caerostris darwini]|uniref:Uncharacterized protein n=1 Tax=Caerostris darwini TaxID=1538125 RepID=A0AAV4WNL8_9ARAC|nr:hypothetical protein CDAR_309321 [Caerostris darwini]
MSHRFSLKQRFQNSQADCLANPVRGTPEFLWLKMSHGISLAQSEDSQKDRVAIPGRGTPEFLWLVRNKSFPLGVKTLSQLTVTGNEMSSAGYIPLRGTCHVGFRVQPEK